MSTHDEDPIGRSYDSRLLRRLLRYLRPYKSAVAVSFLLIVAMAGLDLVGPYLTKLAIDRWIAQGDASGEVQDGRCRPELGEPEQGAPVAAVEAGDRNEEVLGEELRPADDDEDK